MTNDLVKASIAETIGTFILVFFGCGSILVNESNGDMLGLLGVAMAFGLVVMTVIFAIGTISGAHINPAVTIALACAKKFPWTKVLPYIVAQTIGAILAALMLRFSLATGDSLGMTTPSGSIGQAFFLEMIMTAFLMFVVMTVAMNAKIPTQVASIAVASTVVIDILVGGPITGASMNPARSLGPALVMMELDHIWLYLTAPVLGAMLGVLAYAWSAPAQN